MIAAQNLDEFPPIDIADLPETYRKWLEEEVVYIITEAERDIFLRLRGDGQRDRFIAEFWEQRDPTPGTPGNEYQDLHYERLSYANRIYGRGTSTPGWRTARGRIHILLGEPMRVSRVANDGFLNPMEVWFYTGEPRLGLPPFFYVAFYQPYGSGDFRLYSPVSDGPRKLLNGGGLMAVRERLDSGRPMYGYTPLGFSGYEPGEIEAIWEILRGVDIDLASAAFSLFPSDTGSADESPLRSELLLADIARVPDRIMPASVWAERVLMGVTEAEVRFETLPLETLAIGLVDRNGVPFVHFAAQTDGARLNLANYEERYYFTFETSTALTDPSSRVIHHAQDHIQGDLTAGEDQVVRFRTNPFLYIDRLPTVPGNQTFDLVIENNVSREFGRFSVDLEVPSLHPANVTASPPLLCREMHRLPGYDPYGTHYPFQVGEWLLMPSLDNRFVSGGQLLVFQQLLLPSGFGRTLTIAYLLENEEGEEALREVLIVGPDDADSHGIINQTTALDLAGLAAGPYTLSVSVDGWPPVPVELQLAAEPDTARAFVNIQAQPPSSDPAIVLTRAQEYRNVGATDDALALLEDLLRRDPDNGAAAAMQRELLLEAGRYQELLELLMPRVVDRPNDSELLLEMAYASTQLGNHLEAVRYYERARIAGADETTSLLNALALEHIAAGTADRARPLLERSLQLDPRQPEIQRLLDLIRNEEAA